MSKYIFVILLILLVNCVIAETTSECLGIDNPAIEDNCRGAQTSSENYVCVLNEVDHTCVEIVKSECNQVYEPKEEEEEEEEEEETVTTQQEIRRRLEITETLCNSKQTSDNSKYNCVLKNDESCIEEGKSICLRTTIYSGRRRLATAELTDDICKDLSVTSQGKKCVASADKTKCDEVDEVDRARGRKVNYSYGLNINKLTLFALCLLFF